MAALTANANSTFSLTNNLKRLQRTGNIGGAQGFLVAYISRDAKGNFELMTTVKKLITVK